MKPSVVSAFMVILVLPLMSLKALEELKVELGGMVTLNCSMSYHHEINWLRMDPKKKPTSLMVMGLKNDGALSVAWNSDTVRFHGSVMDRFISLKISNVSTVDLGTYFCAASNGKRLEFGEGVHLYMNNQLSGLRSRDDQKSPQQNNTRCPETSPFPSSGEDASEATKAQFHNHMILAIALSCGLVFMVLTIIVVHIKTSRQIVV